MLKLLLAQTAPPAYGSVAKYFLDFADEANADATVLKPGNGQKEAGAWFSARFRAYGCFGRNGVRQAVETSRLFPYDLILAGCDKRRRWLRNSPAVQLARLAWAPVILIPPGAGFRPISNILFLDEQLFTSNQPILSLLRDYWPQHHFIYPPSRSRRGAGSYHCRRFDETGYAAFPRLDMRRLQQYVQRHQIDLVVAGQEDSLQAPGELPVPVLALNSRNTMASRTRASGTAALVPGIASGAGRF